MIHIYVCKVVGKVVSTIRHPALRDGSLIMVRRVDADGNLAPGLLVASDTIGCGKGNLVLVTQGGNARFALDGQAPIDMAVVGILDHDGLPAGQDDEHGLDKH